VATKEFGGLGVPDLRDLNISLLGSWIRRYQNGDRLWREVIDSKYNTKNPNVFCCPIYNASSFWNGVMWTDNVAKMGYRWKIGNEGKISFGKMFR
jgi:hypothetical protein